VGSRLTLTRGANVHCPDCAAQPQTETINPATIDFTSLTKRAEPTERALYVPGYADLERIEAFRTLPLEEFYPEYTRSPKASIQASTITTPTPAPAHTEVPARRVNKRAEPPMDDDPNWQNMYIEKINAFREQHGVTDKVAFSTEALGHADRAAIWNAASGCSWPLPQDATLDKFNWAFWVTDDNTSDFEKEFDISLHMWEVSLNLEDGLLLDTTDMFRYGATAASLGAAGQPGSISSFHLLPRKSTAAGYMVAIASCQRHRA